MLQKLYILLCLIFLVSGAQAQWVTDKRNAKSIAISECDIFIHSNSAAVVKKAATLLQQDIAAVTGRRPSIVHSRNNNRSYIHIEAGDTSAIISSAIRKSNWIDAGWGFWEKGTIRIGKTKPNMPLQVYVNGADPRGAAFAVMEMCRQLGISPWYWWADTPIEKKNLFLNENYFYEDGPQTKYRGIFINDEAPALSNWAREKMGGFNHKFYDKVFELLLRLKGNYIWPAMWGNAFYDDDPLNIRVAEQYGIVIGTSHHEPMMRAHDEWRRYHKGEAWNYETNAKTLQQYWTSSLIRAGNEKIISLGMRGDGDEPMTRETATSLLEKIVNDQRNIIEKVTGKKAEETAQLWALYKEVQDYYDKGMRVPDDVTLLLCDDNWGNLRRVPDPDLPKRSGGYGIYYHFDYVGGPRNYKWINTNPLPRIWEQMNLARQFDARQIWIVNVGDIKPMELPISFFLDMAWKKENELKADDIQSYTRQWAAQQFGKKYADEIASMLSRYAKYNSRRKPELLNAATFSLHDSEWERVLLEYQQLKKQAEKINTQLPKSCLDAYYQLVLHPIEASCNLYEMYYHAAKNKKAYEQKSYEANYHAAQVQNLFLKDSLITNKYHSIKNGKWNHLMSQTHIGYTYWQQPEQQTAPAVCWLEPYQQMEVPEFVVNTVPAAIEIPGNYPYRAFYERNDGLISMAAHHYSRKNEGKNLKWIYLPDHGRKSDAMSSAGFIKLENKISDAPSLEFDFWTVSKDSCTVSIDFSPTLNIFNLPEGFQYAVAINEESPQIFSINKEDTATGTGIWEKWVSQNIIRKKTKHYTPAAGKHRIRIWLLNPGMVLQQIVIDYKKNIETYLGPIETIANNKFKPYD